MGGTCMTFSILPQRPGIRSECAQTPGVPRRDADLALRSRLADLPYPRAGCAGKPPDIFYEGLFMN
jgi:hypothetical protein